MNPIYSMNLYIRLSESRKLNDGDSRTFVKSRIRTFRTDKHWRKNPDFELLQSHIVGFRKEKNPFRHQLTTITCHYSYPIH